MAEATVVQPCANCGGPVEKVRWCYARPTCFTCLPPPPPLPVLLLAPPSAAPTTYAVGDKITRDSLGTVSEVRTVVALEQSGKWLALDDGARIYSDSRAWRPWRPGDDEALRASADRSVGESFSLWDELSAEDAATIAAILRRYQ